MLLRPTTSVGAAAALSPSPRTVSAHWKVILRCGRLYRSTGTPWDVVGRQELLREARRESQIAAKA
jgi:hypothetical protein